MENRTQIMEWWNNLNGLVRFNLTKKYHTDRASHSLTGREIELIYTKENSI